MIATLTALALMTLPAQSATQTPAKPPVIMIHGAGGGGWEYDFWKPVFEKQGFPVVALDLEPTDGDYAKTTVQDYIDQLKTWVPQGQRPVLVGASMGGILSLKVAEELDPVAIVLVNSVAPKGIAEPRPTDDIPDIMVWKDGPFQDTVDSMPDSDRKTQEWAHKLWRNESGQVLRALRQGLEVKKPACPVLVVIGTLDTDITPDTSQKIAAAYNADIKTYSQTSHVGPLLGRRAPEVARDVANWLQSRLTSP